MRHLSATRRLSSPSNSNKGGARNSGDTNRQSARDSGYARRVISHGHVRTKLPESAATSTTVNADLEIKFAGQTVEYKQVPFQLTPQGKQIRITGSIPATLSDFKIDPPSLLTIPVKNEIPVRIDLTWAAR